MFEVKKHKIIIRGLHEIVDNYFSILNDGDIDILYTGTNKFGNRIIGSIVLEDEEYNFFRYFHTLITEDDYVLFVNKTLSLRQLLQSSGSFIIVDKDYNGNEIDYNLASVSDIPNEFLPLEKSFCPDFLKNYSLDYAFSLKGGLSDLHKAEPDVMSLVNNKFCSFLKTSFNFLHSLNITPHVYSETAKTGSFELNFRIEFNEQLTLFTKPNNDINQFLKNFYTYIFSDLPKEEDGALKLENIESKYFKKLQEAYSEIFVSRNLQSGIDRSEQQVIDLITYSVENLKEIEYRGFNKIEVINKTSSGQKIPIAVFDRNFYPSIENKIFKPEELNREAIVEYDDFPVEYSIQIYSLNKETGNGGAYLELIKGTQKSIQKVSLHLRGKNDYNNTVFSKNMDESVFMNVKALAKRVDGVIKEITYNY
jgi:hypothetical protein